MEALNRVDELASISAQPGAEQTRLRKDYALLADYILQN